MRDRSQAILNRAISTLAPRWRSENGTSLVEYALLLALIAMVAFGAIVFFGHTTANSLTNSAQNISQAR